MDNELISEIEQVIDNYEKKRNKLRIICIPLSIIVLVIGLRLLYLYIESQLVVKVTTLAPFLVTIVFTISSIGSKKRNKELLKIKELLDNNKKDKTI